MISLKRCNIKDPKKFLDDNPIYDTSLTMLKNKELRTMGKLSKNSVGSFAYLEMVNAPATSILEKMGRKTGVAPNTKPFP